MDEPANQIERLAGRLLSEGYVGDEVEAYRLALHILMVARQRPLAQPDADQDDDPTPAGPDRAR